MNDIVLLNSDTYPSLSIDKPFLEKDWVLYLPTKVIPSLKYGIIGSYFEITKTAPGYSYDVRTPNSGGTVMPDENTDFSTTKDFKVGDCIFVIEEKHSQRVFGMYLQQDLSIFVAGEPSQNTFDVKKFGPNCKLVSTCGDLVSVDCGAAVDGSFDYVNIKTNEIVSSYGGNCMSPESREYCKANCPPKEWKCNKAIK